LVPGITSTGKDILYEWVDDGASGGGGTIRIVNRTNAAEPELIGSEPAELGGSTSENGLRSIGIGLKGARHAISADGSRIYFQTPAPPLPLQGGGPIFLREDGATTTEVSTPNPGYTSSNPPSTFQWLDASHSQANSEVDGRFAYFWAD